MEGSCSEETLLKLRIYENEESMKWEYKRNDFLRSVKCQDLPPNQDYVVSVDGDQNAAAGAGIQLTLQTIEHQKLQTWKRENTRLLSRESSGSVWNQKWTMNFADKDYDVNSFDAEHIWSSTPVSLMNCYGPNPAFSTSFEEFAKETLINNAKDEAQCQHGE